ncbi:hypothetical protein [Streptomyces kanasensis]|uniref:hypothetical protein n=1 Tax=Streptomyces kanasensis TaxID=936756 RepID=UPI0036F86645
MNGGTVPAGYRSEVLAEGPVYGTGRVVRYVLGAFRTISPVLALRWLRGEALRIADRLDPDPSRSAWVRPAVRVVSVPVPDCPARLRAWATAPDRQRAARERIKNGHPLSVEVPDVDCAYILSAWPVRLSADESAGTAPEPAAQ